MSNVSLSRMAQSGFKGKRSSSDASASASRTESSYGKGSGSPASGNSSGYPHVLIFRRLVNPGLVSLFSHPSLGHGCSPLSGVGINHQLGEVQSPSMPECSISRGISRLHSFQGFSLPSESREAMLNRRRIPIP